MLLKLVNPRPALLTIQRALCAAGVLVALVLAWQGLKLEQGQPVAAIAARLPVAALSNSGSQPAPVDFVPTLPQVADPDGTIRFATRLSEGLSVTIAQIQSRPVSTSKQAFGRVQYDLRLHGDYADIKSLLAGVLSKFPGLSLERLTLHRSDVSSAVAASDVDATVELVQLLAPAAAH